MELRHVEAFGQGVLVCRSLDFDHQQVVLLTAFVDDVRLVSTSAPALSNGGFEAPNLAGDINMPRRGQRGCSRVALE